MKTLVKGNERREFPSELSAEMAIEYYGWSEIRPIQAPIEIGKKTMPPWIDFTPVVESQVNATVETSSTQVLPVEVVPVPVKKTRKSPVRSKSAKR